MDVAGGFSAMLLANSRVVEEKKDDVTHLDGDDDDDELNADTRIDGRRRIISMIAAELLIVCATGGCLFSLTPPPINPT
jgi:hypothetical protein